MKSLTPIFTLTTVLLLSFSTAQARTITVNGHGSEAGTCSDSQGLFCISDLRNRAERKGQDQARWNCQVSGGQPLGYSAYCSSNCYPNTVNPGSSTWVQCNASCSMQCEVN